MCAIFGLGLLRGHKITSDEHIKSLVRALFINNMERGRTASGLAYVSSDTISVIKKNVSANNFINLPEYTDAESKCILTNPDNKNIVVSQYKQPIISVVGHCRLKTKGTELVNLNNHPIIRDNVVGVHNGCICNDDNLFNSFKADFGRYGEVDSEIIFALIDFYSEDAPIHIAIQRMSRIVTGSMACAMVHRNHPHVLWLFRKTNPCDVVIFKEVGLLVWSSSYNYIDRSVLDSFNFGRGEKIEFKENSGMGINLHSNNLHRFKLEGSQTDFMIM